MDSEEDYLLLFSLKTNLEGNNETVKASMLLGDTHWIKKVWRLFGLSSQLHEIQEINDYMKRKIDYLKSFLLYILSCHTCSRIDDKQKREHWCLQWAGTNMTHMSVIMLLMDHVKDDLFCIH